MNQYRPMSKMQINNRLSLGKINKNKFINRQNYSSFQRRMNYGHSAKVYLKNYMQQKFKPKLFSLLDINDKITNSRGTVLPQQYKRLTDEENKRLFGFSYRTDRSYDFSKIRQILGSASGISSAKKKMADDEKINETENKIYNRYNSDIGDIIRNKKLKLSGKDKEEKENNKEIKIEENVNIEPINKFKDNNNHNTDLKMSQNKLTQKEEKQLKKKKKEEKKNIENEKILIRNTNDKYLPKGYISYLVKNQKLFVKQPKNENILNKNLSSTFEQIRQKAYKSDIFFLKTPSEKEISFKQHDLKSYNQQNSDIFNIKNDDQNLLKSSETYLYKKIFGERYNITRESNSKWEPRACIPTLMNHSSKEYNILSPGKKGLGFTKNNIIIECEKKKDSNSKMRNNVNYMNPIYRQKGLAEFIDITRNGASNPGIDFMRTFYNNPKCFYRYDETCSTYNDCHLQYKNLCTRPFVKDPILK